MGNRRYSTEWLLQQAKELFDERGENLTLYDFCRTVGVSTSTVAKHLGGWTHVRETLGQSPRIRRHDALRKYTPQMIIERLRETASREDPMLSLADFGRFTGISPTTVARNFGTWTRLRELADLPPGRRKRAGYSETTLMREFNRVVIELGRFPRSLTEFFRWSRISRGPYKRVYENWKGIVVAYRAFLSRVHDGRPGIACEIPETQSLY